MRSHETPDWIIQPAEAADACADFIRVTVDGIGAAGVVIGLSGGIDSAVAAALAVRALGNNRVLSVTMPYHSSDPASLADAMEVAAALDVAVEHHEITAMAEPFMSEIPSDARLRRGNIMARCRMVVLYDLSARDGSLVLGTGNRSETLLGYATLHGDDAFALNPLGDLYKAEVNALAQYLELPESVILKAPSADLWEGQSDEQELGFTYDEADRLLHGMIDEGLAPRQLEALGFSRDLIREIRRRVAAQAFKWLPVPYAKILDRPMPDVESLREAG